MLAPWRWCLPEYQDSVPDGLRGPCSWAIGTSVRSRATNGHCSVRAVARTTCRSGALSANDVDRLVQVPVGRGERDARVPGEQVHAGRVLEPAQHEQRLRARGRGALPGADVAGAAVGRDPVGHDRQGVGGHVEGGTIGDQAESQSSSLCVWRLASWSGAPATAKLTTGRTCRSARRSDHHASWEHLTEVFPPAAVRTPHRGGKSSGKGARRSWSLVRMY